MLLLVLVVSVRATSAVTVVAVGDEWAVSTSRIIARSASATTLENRGSDSDGEGAGRGRVDRIVARVAVRVASEEGG